MRKRIIESLVFVLLVISLLPVMIAFRFLNVRRSTFT